MSQLNYNNIGDNNWLVHVQDIRWQRKQIQNRDLNRFEPWNDWGDLKFSDHKWREQLRQNRSLYLSPTKVDSLSLARVSL